MDFMVVPVRISKRRVTIITNDKEWRSWVKQGLEKKGIEMIHCCDCDVLAGHFPSFELQFDKKGFIFDLYVIANYVNDVPFEYIDLLFETVKNSGLLKKCISLTYLGPKADCFYSMDLVPNRFPAIIEHFEQSLIDRIARLFDYLEIFEAIRTQQTDEDSSYSYKILRYTFNRSRYLEACGR